MAEPSIIAEIIKSIHVPFLAVKDAVLSIRGMVFLLCASSVGAFVPLAWWNKIGMLKIGRFCAANYEWFLLGVGISLLLLILLLIQDKWESRKRKKEFDSLMSTLNPAEVKALCNAFHNNGKYSIPSCAAELESLKKHDLIVVSSEPGNFGGREFVLSHDVCMYLKVHTDYFSKRGVAPDPPAEARAPFFAVV